MIELNQPSSTLGRGVRKEEFILNKYFSIGICIDVKERMKAFPMEIEYEETILRIYKRAKHSEVSVIVIFGSRTVIRHLMKAALKHTSIAPRRFTWIGSDGWGNRVEFVGAEANPALGALTIMMRRGETAQEFKDYYSSFNLTNYPRKNKRFATKVGGGGGGEGGGRREWGTINPKPYHMRISVRH